MPQVTVTQWPFRAEALESTGNRWITHHHYHPNNYLKDYIRQNEIVLITTVRHPADVLISMYHHITGFRSGEVDAERLRRMMREDFERSDVIPERVGAPFHADLSCSIEWARSGMTRLVRYEDLRSNTFEVLNRLTNEIHPEPASRIEAAISACDLQLMRALAGRFGGFFRRARIGEWTKILPDDVADMFSTVDPYPALCAALGYSMDPDEAGTGRILDDRPRHPMLVLKRFSNGVPVAPILKKCFFVAAPRELQSNRVADLAATGPGSFYEWLRQRLHAPGRAPFTTLRFSNLELFIYEERPDVQRTFPDLTASDRGKYMGWFIRYAQAEYQLPAEFIEPAVRESERFKQGFELSSTGCRARD